MISIVNKNGVISGKKQSIITFTRNNQYFNTFLYTFAPKNNNYCIIILKLL